MLYSVKWNFYACKLLNRSLFSVLCNNITMREFFIFQKSMPVSSFIGDWRKKNQHYVHACFSIHKRKFLKIHSDELSFNLMTNVNITFGNFNSFYHEHSLKSKKRKEKKITQQHQIIYRKYRNSLMRVILHNILKQYFLIQAFLILKVRLFLIWMDRLIW